MNSGLSTAIIVVALTAVLPSFAFTIIYGIFSPWYKSWLGRAVFSFFLSLSVLFIYIVSRLLFSDYTGYQYFGLTAYGFFSASFWFLAVMLIIERRHPGPLEFNLQRQITGEIPTTKGKES